ncbi:MAG TPA: hypothetical protein VIV58_21245 [Kofleriaceae bacterium]
MQRLRYLVLAAVTGCATPYAYHFQLVEAPAQTGDTFEDAIVKARLRVDGDAIELEVTNKTSELLQVEWSKIQLDRGDGTTAALHAATDLGWIQPGGNARADLVPVAFPHEGDAALAYQHRRIELAVPVIANREPSTYHFHFLVSVQAE